jgi:replicative DNA helicase
MVDNIDLDVLKVLSRRETYDIYSDVIHKGLCTKESWTLVQDFGRYFKQYPEVEEIDSEFTMWFRITGHPGWKPEAHKAYESIVSNVIALPVPNGTVFRDQLESLRFGSELTKQHGKLQTGAVSVGDVLETLTDGYQVPVGNATNSQSETFTLDDLAQHQRSDDGLYWRLEDLNKAIGPVRTGDVTIVGKRPEVGGTSFLCSEMSHMLEQLPKDGKAVFFNNEEAPDKVFTRMISAALDVEYRQLMSNPKKYQEDYEDWLDGRQWDLIHDTAMDISKIRRTLREEQYDLIGINVLLKVGGTGKQEDHDRFEALGIELRKLSQEYGPVLAIVQADPSAEGIQYIPQDRIYKSKTALQGEADILIMIGMDNNAPPHARFIHVAKNKIPPAPCCDLSVKHIRSQCNFDIGTGRFTSDFFKSHSRPM